jgi:hypothetical protein
VNRVPDFEAVAGCGRDDGSGSGGCVVVSGSDGHRDDGGTGFLGRVYQEDFGEGNLFVVVGPGVALKGVEKSF